MKKNKSYSQYKLDLKKNDILCVTNDKEYDLYYIISGKLMVCVTQNTQVIPLAYIGADQYLGELSFFDRRPRSATVIAVEDTEVVKIPTMELKAQVPIWIISVAVHMTKKIRLLDEIIQENGIRKKNVAVMKPLSIDEQRMYYSAIEDHIISE